MNGLLTGNRQQSAADIGRQVNLVGAGYDQANAYQQQVANAGQNRINALAQQLNAGPAQIQAQTQLESTLAGILGQNGQARANATGNLGTWGAQWDQILGNGINIGEQTRAKASSDFETELLKLLGQNKVAGLEGENDLQGRLADILGSRQNDLISTYNQLSQQDWENAFRQAQLDQEAQSKNASLALQSRGLDLQASGQASDNAYRNAQMAKGDSISPTDLLKMMLGQQESAADRTQSQSDTRFNQNMALKNFDLDTMKAMGSGNDGNSMLADFVGKMAGSDTGLDEDAVSKYALMLDQLGFPNSLAQQMSAPASMPALTNPAYAGGASRSNTGSGSGGGFSFNPGNWLTGVARGMGGMWR